jgi:rhomboid protease GluP
MSENEQPEFQHYSTAQLQAELARRQLDSQEFSVTFTRYDGWRGWLLAKMTRSPVFGSGTVSFGDDALSVHGWQRTWLGAAVEAVVQVTYSTIRRVSVDRSLVQFQATRGRSWSWTFELGAHSPEIADELATRLTSRAQAAPDPQWEAIRSFHRGLEALTPHTRITLLIVLVNALVFGIMSVAARTAMGIDPATAIRWGANYGPLTTGGEWWRVFTATLLHHNFVHLLLNMWVLFGAGRLTERLFGSARFAFIYLASGIGGSIGSLAWQPGNVAVGASGAVFGVLGAFLAFLWMRRREIPRGLLRAYWLSTSLFVLYSLVTGALEAQTDNAAHLVGLLTGLLLGFSLARPLSEHATEDVSRGLRLAPAMSAAAMIGAGLFYVVVLRPPLTPTEQLWAKYPEYPTQEAENLRAWIALISLVAQGQINETDFVDRFDKEILPFWTSMAEQFEKAGVAPSGSSTASIDSLLAEYVRLRSEWGHRIVALVRRDGVRSANMAPDLRAMEAAVVRMEARLARMSLRAASEQTPAGLANLPFITRLMQRMVSSSSECFVPDESPNAPVSASDDPSDGPAARQAVGCRAQALFATGDHRSLDALMQKGSAALGDLPDGSSSFEGIASGLDDHFGSPGFDWNRAFRTTAAWRMDLPGSIHAELVETLVLRAWAWEARGGGPANSVTPQGWALYRIRSEMTAVSLAEVADRGAAHPLWHQLMLSNALDRSRDTEEIRELFDVAHGRFPEYWSLHRQMLRALMPRWGGSYGKVDAFINNMYGAAASDSSYETYTALYWMYSNMEGDIDIFEEAQANWTDMKIGFEGLLKKHPSSDYILNGFAHFACRAGDRDAYANLRQSLDARLSASAWTVRHSMSECDRLMARGS